MLLEIFSDASSEGLQLWDTKKTALGQESLLDEFQNRLHIKF